MRRLVRRLAWATALSFVTGCFAVTSAVATAMDPRLLARLDAPTARQVQVEIEQAKAEGLPTDPLILKALEGGARGASEEKIVAAVRRNAKAIREASRALGPVTTEAELIAGAGAILAGAPPDSLRSLRSARGDSSLVVPLVVISDLLARRVPAREATGLVVSSWRGGMSGTTLLRMREGIHHDIQEGVAPSVAALRAWDASARREGSRLPSEPSIPPVPRPPRTDKK